MSENKKKVYEKIAKVSKSVGVVSKDATNIFHGYQYQSGKKWGWLEARSA